MNEATINKINNLSNKLGFITKTPQLLVMALTHRSVGNVNNERLEFLGDSILNFVISDYLYNRFPDVDEGVLTRLRANLVRQQSLVELAELLDLGKYIILGPGERKTGGHQRSSILADTLEAIIGAIYVGLGDLAAKNFILQQYQPKFDAIELSSATAKDPKTRLQELVQAKQLSLPVYEVLSTTGPQHDQQFLVQCNIAIAPSVTGFGTSRRLAEQAAATAMLQILEQTVITKPKALSNPKSNNKTKTKAKIKVMSKSDPKSKTKKL